MGPAPRTLHPHRSFLVALILTVPAVGCGEATASMLSPAGPEAAATATIWWVMFWLAAVIYVVVIGILLYVTVRRSLRKKEPISDPDLATGPPPKSMSMMIVVGGIVVPAVVLAGLMVTTVVVGADMSGSDDNDVVVDVIGHEWWWEVRYTDPQTGRDVATANEIHIPAGEPVTFRLSASDVIHSFWVPELGGKIDNIPGATNVLELEADEPGTYRGQCAEYCGLQHANMAFLVIAQERDEFDEWLAHQATPAQAPDTESVQRGEEAYVNAACVYCHTIEGGPGSGELGPDLTHFASRQTIGSGMLENNRGNLAGWIMDPQGIKPGNYMPASDLDGHELQDLLAYLETLD